MGSRFAQTSRFTAPDRLGARRPARRTAGFADSLRASTWSPSTHGDAAWLSDC